MKQLELVQLAFDGVDKDRLGFVGVQQFEAFLEAIGNQYDVDYQQIEELADPCGSGFVTFSNVVSALSKTGKLFQPLCAME